MKRPLRLFTITTVLGIGCALFFAYPSFATKTNCTENASAINNEQATNVTSSAAQTKANRTVSIACVGDMFLGLNYPSDAPLLPVHDGAHLFDDVKSYLEGADIAAGNLEGLLLDKGGTVRKVNDPKYAYFFRMPERYINHFVNAGFDFLSVANNHLRDFGEVGIQSTLDILERSGIAYAGLKGRCEIDILERDGVRYGFCAFAPFIDM